jgi:hypothetical protein
MCTVTVLPYATPDGEVVRLACNRDEQRSRPQALPPRLHPAGQLRAAWPTDPAGGGTWIGINEARLALALLNVNRLPHGKGGATRSRGSIIPYLLHCDSLESALHEVSRLSPALYAPFRLLLLDGRLLAEAVSDGAHLRVSPGQRIGPLLWTSSGLGDAIVEGPRRELFAEHCRMGNFDRGQDSFHQHHWPDRPHLSVCMRRPDAATVSYTTITLSRDQICLTYHAAAPDTPAERFSLGFERTRGGVAP